MGASTAGVRGREVRDWGLTGGVRGTERGNERMREGIGADWAAGGREGERAHVCERGRSLVGGSTCQATQARAQPG